MLPETIDRIRYWHRQRCAAMDARKTIDLRLGAHLRTFLGWSKALPEKERKVIAQRAADMIAGDNPGEFADFIAAFQGARVPFVKIEARAEREIGKLASTLPVWAIFGEPIRGFGPVSLAIIVAEAGDLSAYANHSKLWKRMGLAVMDDIRQGGLGKGANAEDWIEHGYSPQRRSRMWNIGDALIKGNRDGAYRTVYLARKEYELMREPDMAPIKAHRRAQRYMEKRLLRNLWRAWRDEAKASARLPEKVRSTLLTPQPSEREATSEVPERATERLPTAQPHEAKAIAGMPARAVDNLPTPHPTP